MNREAIKTAVDNLQALLDTPESAAYAMDTLAEKFDESAAECASAWQDKSAGRCWTRCAAMLRSAAITVAR